MKLGKLEKVKDLRSFWKHEANDFTKIKKINISDETKWDEYKMAIEYGI